MRKNSSNYKFFTWLVISIPLINVVAGLSVQLLGRDAFHFGFIRGAVLFFVILLSLYHYKIKDTVIKFLLIYLIYLFLLTFFSSNFALSFDTWVKVFASMMMFPVGFYVINDFEKLNSLLKVILITAVILCLNYIYAQIFDIGRSVYVEDSFYYGLAGIGATVTLAYSVIAFPLLRFEPLSRLNKWVLYLTIFLSVLFILLALKRVAILALFLGFVIYAYKSKRLFSASKSVVLLFAVFVITSPFYLDVLEDRVDARIDQTVNIDQESRFNDTTIAIYHFNNSGVKHALFGSELFNTQGYLNTTRQVHVDYAILLLGSGLIGLILYLFLHAFMLYRFGKYFRFIKRKVAPQYLYDINGVYWGILGASLIISLSGGIHSIGSRSMVFLLAGACYGIVKRMYLENQPGYPHLNIM